MYLCKEVRKAEETPTTIPTAINRQTIPLINPRTPAFMTTLAPTKKINDRHMPRNQKSRHSKNVGKPVKIRFMISVIFTSQPSLSRG